MPVPFLFSNIPGGSSIPLASLDANFAYLTVSPVFTGNITVDGNSTLGNVTITGALTFGGQTVVPTGATGTGSLVFNTGPTLVAPILGTPASGNLSNCTNLPISSVTGLGANVSNFLVSPTSANLDAAVTDSTGTGNLVFSTAPALAAPVLTAPVLGTPASGNLSACTGYSSANLSGVVPVTLGGTGLNAAGAVGQVLIVTAPGTLGYAASPPSGGVAGGAPSQLLYQVAPNDTDFIPNGLAGQVLLSNGAAVPSWGQLNAATGLTGVVPIAQGGTNSSTRQQAMDTLAGSATFGQYLRGNGTNVVMSAIVASDVPVLNQNTTGSAATFTSTTQNSQFNSIGVNVAASATPGQINATGNVSTSSGFFTDSTGTLHPLINNTATTVVGANVIIGGIPSWARRIVVMLNGVVKNTTNDYLLQLGTTGGFVATGYKAGNYIINTDNLVKANGNAFFVNSTLSTMNLTYTWTLDLINPNIWMMQGLGLDSSGSDLMLGAGSVVIPGAVSQINLLIDGAGAYTAGTISVTYE